jgi:hypothetical protein
VLMTKRCRSFGVSGRTTCHLPTEAAYKVEERSEMPIKAMIDRELFFVCFTVANLLGPHGNTLHRLFQIRRFQAANIRLGLLQKSELRPRWRSPLIHAVQPPCSAPGQAQMARLL